MSEQWCFFSVSRRDNFPNHDDHVLLRPQQTSTPIRSKLDHVQYMASDTWCSLFKKKKMFLAVLGLCCSGWVFSSCSVQAAEALGHMSFSNCDVWGQQL